jgi:hypothetical protein
VLDRLLKSVDEARSVAVKPLGCRFDDDVAAPEKVRRDDGNPFQQPVSWPGP